MNPNKKFCRIVTGNEIIMERWNNIKSIKLIQSSSTPYIKIMLNDGDYHYSHTQTLEDFGFRMPVKAQS